jgi:hypothetical protein
MVKRIVLTYPDGRIALRGNVASEFLARHGGDLDAALQDILVNYVPKQNPDAVATLVDIDVPQRDYLRNSWCFDGLKIDCDMPKARTIHMDAIRVVRNAELAAKDIPWMKAVEAGDTDAQATIATEKQTLRDIPQTFDLTTGVDTPEKLKQKWPTELPDRE